MNLIERLILSLMAILFVAFTTVLLLAPDTVTEFVARVNDLNILLRLLIVVVLYATMMGMAYLGFRRGSASPVKGLQVRSSGTVTSLTIESAQDQVKSAIEGVESVLSSGVRIKSVRGRANVMLDVVVSEVDKLPNKQREITRALDKVMKRQLGVRYASRPVVRLRFEGDPSPAMITPEPAHKSEPASPPVGEEDRGRGGLFSGFRRRQNESKEVNEQAKPQESVTSPEEGKATDDSPAIGSSTLPLARKAGQSAQPDKSDPGKDADKDAPRRGMFGGRHDNKTDDDSPTVIGRDDDEEDNRGTEEFYEFLKSSNVESAADDDDTKTDTPTNVDETSDAAKDVNQKDGSDESKFNW